MSDRLLKSLNDQAVGVYRLWIKAGGRTRHAGQQDFTLCLCEPSGHTPVAAVFRGRYNAGRPSIHVPTWIDGEFLDPVDVAELRESLQKAIAAKLGMLIPPGGRLWLAYEAFDHDGPWARETRAALAARVPLLATPIGELMFHAGCWAGLRDWYIAEGGREGPRKLQGNKAQDDGHARRCAETLIRELDGFMARPSEQEVVVRAQARARRIVPDLQKVMAQPLQPGGSTDAG